MTLLKKLTQLSNEKKYIDKKHPSKRYKIQEVIKPNQ